MQYPVGALTGTPHAVGVAAIFPAWLAQICRVAPERLAPLAAALGTTGSPDESAAGLADRVASFMARIGMQLGLRDLGVSASDLPRLVDMVEGTLENDPGPIDRKSILALYQASL
jgi:alcohol dehydrogenase class IV